MSVEEELELICRGCEEVIGPEELASKLEKARREGRPLVIKWGADPSAPDLHLGHMVPVRKLRELQELGHEIVFLIGDYTARIGDPTGKSETRRQLSAEEVERNAATYTRQIFKILDEDKTRVVFNSRWLAELKLQQVIEVCATCTVAQMLEREDFDNRYKAGRPISLHEFLYPLLQAYDSVELGADIEVGATEQKFNLLMGRQLQRHFGQEPQVCLLFPILVGTDGVNKMSKSLGNYIGIDEPPGEMFGKVMSIDDETMFVYYRLVLGTDDEELARMRAGVEGGRMHPMELKKRLAMGIVELYHGPEAARSAREEFERVFSRRDLPTDLEEKTLEDLGLPRSGRISVPRLFSAAFGFSSSEAKRLARQGALRIDDEKVSADCTLDVSRLPVVLRAGKRRFCRVV